MNRLWLKKRKSSAFGKKMEDLGADYLEGEGSEEQAVFIIDKKQGGVMLAVRVMQSGSVKGFVYMLGQINESCQNFERLTSCNDMNKYELKWVIKIFDRLLE